MKRLFVTIPFLCFCLALFAGQPIDETMQEEVGLNLRKLTDDNLCLGHLYIVKPVSFQGSIAGCSAKQKFYWSTFRRMHISPEGDELTYINISDKKGNVMVRKTTSMTSAIQRTFRDVRSVSWGSDDKLYFADYTNGNDSKIFATNSHAGSVMQQITNAASDDDPILAADGKTLFFTRYETGGGASIWAYNLDDGSLLSCCRGFNPYPVGEGNEEFLCVRNTAKGQSEIWLVNYVKGQETLILSDAERGFTNPVLSPDGQWIVCEGNSKSTVSKKQNLDLFAVRIDGSHFSQLTFHPAMECCPTFSKDGKTLYFLSNRSQKKTNYCNIWSMKFPF